MDYNDQNALILKKHILIAYPQSLDAKRVGAFLPPRLYINKFNPPPSPPVFLWLKLAGSRFREVQVLTITRS